MMLKIYCKAKAPSLNEYDEYIKEITRELGLYNIVNNQSLYHSKFHYTPVSGSELVSISGKTFDNTRAIEDASLKTDINNMDIKAIYEDLQKLRKIATYILKEQATKLFHQRFQ